MSPSRPLRRVLRSAEDPVALPGGWKAAVYHKNYLCSWSVPLVVADMVRSRVRARQRSQTVPRRAS